MQQLCFQQQIQNAVSMAMSHTLQPQAHVGYVFNNQLALNPGISCMACMSLLAAAVKQHMKAGELLV
eukprot:365466-Chlamydomonas_euryale.AAC.2